VSHPSAPADGEPLRYRDVARGGLSRVVELAGRDDWPAAAEEARGLKDVFREAADRFGPVPAEVFDGLLAACMARDPDELGDFAELVEEMFP
jgi:hypothetical protein